jgi:glycosyltransferase involved in cell wall biosynthesis
MVGNGPLESELKQKASSYPYIQFLPFQNQSQMPLVYRLGDLLCLPSKGPGETWGLAVNETLACGRQVLVSNKVGGAIDLVREGTAGSIFKSEDLEDLINNMINLVKHPFEKQSKVCVDMIRNWSYTNICCSFEESLLGR